MLLQDLQMTLSYKQKMEYPFSCGLVFKLIQAGFTKCLESTRLDKLTSKW